MFKLFIFSVIVLLQTISFANQEVHNAIRNNNMGMLKYFVEKAPKDIDKKDDLGYTPLHLAVRKNDSQIVEYLLEFNPDVNTQDKFGDTPLIDAARNNNTNIVKLLVCANATKNIKNQDGKTALDFLSENKQYETALFLQKSNCTEDIEQEKKNLIEKLRKLK